MQLQIVFIKLAQASLADSRILERHRLLTSQEIIALAVRSQENISESDSTIQHPVPSFARKPFGHVVRC
jgi:hypothetical protein